MRSLLRRSTRWHPVGDLAKSERRNSRLPPAVRTLVPDVLSSRRVHDEFGPEGAFRIVVAALRFYRPINQERPPHDGITVNKSPVTAVLAVIAIVAHRKILPWRDNKLVPLHVLADLGLPFRDRVGGHHLSACGGERVVERVSKHR